jgi:hypothetical protein
MNNYFLFKFIITQAKEYIFIFLTATIFSTIIFTSSFSEENIFTIKNVKVKGTIDLKFSREKYLHKAFINSFETLMAKVLLSRDFKKIKKANLKEVKNLISSFHILEENFIKNEYEIKLKIKYNEKKIKRFLNKKNISFSQPDNISAIFFPILIENNEIKSFDENFFYKEWLNVEIKNELVNYILPLDDLDDVMEIAKIKNKIEDINVASFVDKYDIKNYIFTLMEFEKNKLKIHLKANFNNKKVNNNYYYDIENLKDKKKLDFIIKDLKVKITDIWKEENLINLLMPLSIKIKFNYSDLEEIDKLKLIFNKINIIDNSVLKEFSINTSTFKIYYYGNPKKLESELSKFGYTLKNDQGLWQIYTNE